MNEGIPLEVLLLDGFRTEDFLSDGRRRTEATEDLAIGGLGDSSAEEEFCLPRIEGEDKSTYCVTLCVLTLWQSDIEKQSFKKVGFHQV